MTEHEDDIGPQISSRPYYQRIPGANVDLVDVGAGMAMLEQTGHTSKLTQMVIEHSLQLWARGEEASAEKKAIDKSFNGIDMTSWRMVLAAAVSAGQQRLEDQAPGRPSEDAADVEHEEVDEDNLDQAAREALLLDQPWEDAPEIELPHDSGATAENHALPVREATAQDVIMLLLEHHSSDGQADCGARTAMLPCDWTRGRSMHPRHCTLEPGHDGLHKDALHCWSFETFDETQVERYEPRDLSGCQGCQQPTRWPCDVSKEALEIARQLGIQVPPEYA